MRLIKDIESNNLKNTVITVGTFDGLHLGHQKIIKTLVERAEENNSQASVFTFWPHPRFVLGKINGLELLNTFEEKVELFKQNGIDNLISYEFTKEFANLSSREFVKQFLVEKLNVKHLILGYDHHFGKNREGEFKKLQECANEFGFTIEKVSALSQDDENVSSTKIRNYIKSGEIEKANEFLGYVYFLQGHVVKGNKLGRKIGFPTANISVPSYKLLPKSGVYTVKVNIDNKLFIGIMNIGFRPTIGKFDNKTLEVHIINFDEDIYQKTIKVEIFKRIRDEEKFEDLEELKNQIAKDKDFASNFFK
jgi:riboflavin kinase/FMN adenylyltransferase